MIERSTVPTPFATPPAPGAPRSATLPTPAEVIPHPTARAEQAVRSRLFALGYSEAISTGTTKATALEIAQQIDALGARLDASSGFDASVVSVNATTPVFRDAFALFRELQEPAFAPAEVERVRTKSIGDLGLTYSNPSALRRDACRADA